MCRPAKSKKNKAGSFGPDETGWSVYLKKFAPAILKTTEGKVLFKFYWAE